MVDCTGHLRMPKSWVKPNLTYKKLLIVCKIGNDSVVGTCSNKAITGAHIHRCNAIIGRTINLKMKGLSDTFRLSRKVQERLLWSEKTPVKPLVANTC